MIETEADKRLETARASINTAVLALSDIVVSQCWGHDQFSEEFKATIDAAFTDLLRIRREL